MEGFAAAELEAAERLVKRWDSTASAASSAGRGGDNQMLFDGAADRAEAERFLRAVDDLRRLAPPSPASVGSPRRASSAGGVCTAVEVAMTRLEDEFRHVLSARALDLEIEALAGLSSLSMASGRSNSDATEAAAGEEDDGSVSSSVGRRSSYRSLQSIREIDLFPADAISDLHAIASRMAAAGYGRECVQVYASVRKPAVDSALRRLGVEKLSIGDVQRLEWDALEAKIRRWIRAARAAVRGVFASERCLCLHIFNDLPLRTSTATAAAAAAPTNHDAPFAEAVKGAALQLFGFAEAISIGRRSPEKLFKIIDLHDALSDMLPDISDIFADSKAAESIYVQAAEIKSRLVDAVRGILSEFENAVLRDPSKTPVPGGTIHPLTRYVMNYSTLISDYKATLSELIISRPSASPQTAAEENEATPAFPDLDPPDPDSQLPLATHLVWIIVVLEHNLESKASLYKDAPLSHLFLMNNVHYIVHKVKDSAELRGLIGDEYLRRLTGKFRQAATSYQRTAWLKILNCLRDEGLHVSGGFSSGVSKSALRERFKAFNAVFEEAHRVQSAWYVPDTQLREELRISVLEKLLPAYRSFLGRFRHHIENSRHPELYIKYSVDDLEIAMADFFEGSPPSLHNRRRSHG
ncbi:Exocyst complex component EXO70B1 [Zea mays]|jgi:exocyst complex component 7|uniref:Exocyst subunit Exo70 family protein n=2 Tax=Zea mays TaxID=4577 RepID=A0A1D6ER13_MAIZE|nr:exocyst complex component EXO70B1 [Zea mays]ONM22177.1 exocyst subunit exo70 family protein D1 [Zea mays]PWZ38103.1 Exocyst complex component EXO70B1 [Zea mays]|eukprot:XP_008670223.1 exocyst complex component EXO70B1 [Zea mays]